MPFVMVIFDCVLRRYIKTIDILDHQVIVMNDNYLHEEQVHEEESVDLRWRSE